MRYLLPALLCAANAAIIVAAPPPPRRAARARRAATRYSRLGGSVCRSALLPGGVLSASARLAADASSKVEPC